MKHIFALLVTAGLLLLHPASYGQQAGKLISGDFAALPFEQFARQLESQAQVRLYFDPAAVDSLSVTLRVSQQPLSSVLEQALKGSGLRFVLDDENRGFIFGGNLNPALPETFFQAASAGSTPAVEEPSPVPTARVRSLASAEGKVYEVGAGGKPGARATLAGHVRDVKTGEPVIGASVFVEALNVGASTDQFGYFSLTLPVGRYELKVRGVGIKSTRRQIQLRASGKLDIDVQEDIVPLKEVVVQAEKDKNVASTQMGVERLDIKTMRQVPTAFGETDILRVVLTLPGVKSVGEGSTGLNVRGGATDQNLILFNDATVYNPSHLFGFFSAFNPDILQTVELYKSAIPAKYGGRLSSVLDISTREGNKKKFSGSGGIGPLTSRLTLEGPLAKDRSAFLISGRASYSDWLLKQLSSKSFQQSSAAFYDITAHISHQLNDKNALYATGYLSRDRFRLASDTTYQYLNQSASLKWRHTFTNQLTGVLTGTYSHYDYDISNSLNEVNASRLQYSIDQPGLRVDFGFFPNAKHTIDFGASSQLYRIQPGSLRPNSAASLVVPDVLPQEQAVESALYVSDRYDISPRLSVAVGLRYSFFQALGQRDVFQYLPGEPRSESSITDTLHYDAGKVVANYHGPEYRVAARFSLSDNSSVKASYNRTRQYIHQLSNTASVSPADIWKLSDSHIRPQVGDQYSLGYYHNFKGNTIETSVEGYYKSLQDFVDYKGGATLLLNHHIETEIVNATGKAYGVEILVKKLSGKINGWVSYTYSRSLVQVNAGTTSEMINGGNYYPSNFDKPHDVTMVGNYRVNRRFSASLNFNYSTGRPITLPLAKYQVGSSTRVFYSDRNAYRVPDYYRLDLALNIEGNHKLKKLAHGSWTIGVYNVTGRRNPYSVYFRSEGGKIKGYQLSIFGQPIPTITYNFKF